MSIYAKHISPRVTPQSQAIPGREADMAVNNAGGVVFKTDSFTQLKRFLILGAEGGTYYTGEAEHVKQNVVCLDQCIQADPGRTVETICDVSVNGKAPKNDPAVFALAYCCRKGSPAAEMARASINKVCRIGTHFFQFVGAMRELGCWTREDKTAMANWYTSRTPENLAFQVTKYANREGWTHADVLKMLNVRPTSDGHNAIFRYLTCGREGLGERQVIRRTHGGKDKRVDTYPSVTQYLPGLFDTVEEIKACKDAKRCARLIRENGAVREVVPTELLNSVEVWDALLETMPPEAMMRNLGKMTNIGLLKPLSSQVRMIVDKLGDKEVLRKARLHPMNILFALRTYQSGHGFLGNLSWSPVQQIVSALDEAFYLSFDTAEPTGKNFMFCLDVSGSMSGSIASRKRNRFGKIEMQPGPLSCCEAGAALVMLGLRTEKYSEAFGFNHTLTPLKMTKQMDLMTATRTAQSYNFGSTDAAQPMIYATQNRLDVDCFVVITDNETWSGQIQPVQALNNYRQRTGKDAKEIVMAMTSTGFSIADPNDRGMMDVCGFDTSVPPIMSEFVTNGF